MNLELVIDAHAELGEGPAWDAAAQRLIWVDIEAGLVHLFHPSDGTLKTFEIGRRVGAALPRRDGGLLLATADGFALLDDDTGRVTMRQDPESDLPGNRFNDGKCDPSGRFWAGTMSLNAEQEPNRGALYRLDPGGTYTRHLSEVSISNGLAWTADGQTMYYIDTPTGRVDAFDFDPDEGAISNRRSAFEVPRDLGFPDGMCVDVDDHLWVAHWGGNCVSRWDPREGTMKLKIPLPATQVTSCAFGGDDGGDLYITTARTGLDETTLQGQPHAGGLFRCRPGVTGPAAVPFAG